MVVIQLAGRVSPWNVISRYIALIKHCVYLILNRKINGEKQKNKRLRDRCSEISEYIADQTRSSRHSSPIVPARNLEIERMVYGGNKNTLYRINSLLADERVHLQT